MKNHNKPPVTEAAAEASKTLATQVEKQAGTSGPYTYTGPCSTAMLDGKTEQGVVTGQVFQKLDPSLDPVKRLIDQGHLVLKKAT